MNKPIAALLTVACLLTASLWAGRVDVVDRAAAAGPESSTVSSKRLVSSGDFRLSVDVETRFNAANETYTYIFTLHSSQASAPLEKFDLFLDKLQARSPNLNWGVVNTETSPGVDLQGITWGHMTANLSDGRPGLSGGLDAGESITFYVQSKVPPSLAFDVDTNQWHEPTPEPATLLLFGSSLLLAYALLRKKVAFRS
jgi:hypothetical protein